MVKTRLFGILLTLGVSQASAQTASSPAPAPAFDTCSDMVAMRNRNASLSLAINKIIAGAQISVTSNSDLTPRFIVLSFFDNYFCRLDQAMTPYGGLKAELRQAWTSEIIEVFDTFVVATQGKDAGTMTESLTKASKALRAQWDAGGAKTLKFADQKLEKNVSAEFQKAVPAKDLTKSVTATGYMKTILGQQISGNFETSLIAGENISGNLLYTLQDIRKDFVIFAGGTTSVSTLIRNTILHIAAVSEQLAGKKSDELLKYEIDSRMKYAAQISVTVTDLNTRLSTLEKKVTDDAATIAALKAALPPKAPEENKDGG